jgi:hypothetical protein
MLYRSKQNHDRIVTQCEPDSSNTEATTATRLRLQLSRLICQRGIFPRLVFDHIDLIVAP